MNPDRDQKAALLRDVVQFAEQMSRLKLRSYQVEVAERIVESVRSGLGLTFVVVFPRQSGKNELQAQIEAYLLCLYSRMDCEIVKVSPTWKPQSLNAMRRLERVLKKNLLTLTCWKKESGYIYCCDQARIFFLSGEPTSSVVGATASLLLECDEAQDVLPAKWDKEFSPMAAATNATRVFWGTAWTSQTLLARERRAAEQAQQQDGRRRVWVLSASDVRQEVPAYGKFVDEQVAKLGRNHPMVRTQYFSEEIDSEGGMFPPARRALMQGSHAPLTAPVPGRIYALLLDVAGEDEAAGDRYPAFSMELVNARRDSTALTVVEVDLSTLADELVRAPTYRVVDRCQWTGVKHTTLYGVIRALAEHWEARYLVVDATGVGAGLASFLEKALPGRVLPFIFSAQTKSDLGWGFLAAVETGRYKEYRAAGGASPCASHFLQALFWKQVAFCQSYTPGSPGNHLRWGVPDGTRDPETGELVHDDLLLSATLCARLDSQPWGLAESAVVRARDPLEDLHF